ncbi:MAG: NADH-quinone oxidoreductase subunit J [Candidatus Zixiibacteriota bacterium]|nr:MAG: NADH-quinone oxidoreductase subunit J [candidate division Zixibacteria bacterium]
MNLDLIIFVVSAIVAIFGASMMIFQRNPIASVLFLILSLVAQAVLYIQLSALFMGAMLIIVYSGAILVLFLFVIMMLNLRAGEDLGAPSSPISKTVKYSISFLMFVELAFIFRGGTGLDSAAVGIMNTSPDNFGSIEQIAELLFTRYLYPFELTSILLLAAIVGAVIIARRDSVEDGSAVIESNEQQAIDEVQN